MRATRTPLGPTLPLALALGLAGALGLAACESPSPGETPSTTGRDQSAPPASAPPATATHDAPSESASSADSSPSGLSSAHLQKFAPESTHAESVVVTVGDGVAVDIAPEAMAPEAPLRPRKRMDIDQLEGAITAVTGGLTWIEVQPNGTEVNLFEELAGTLGKPDFAERTVEDLEPGALFQKFLGDASRSVCARLLDAEALAAPEDRVFLTHADFTMAPTPEPKLVRHQLSAHLLRFHGAEVAPDSPQLEPWSFLLNSAYQVALTHEDPEPVKRAWWAVCVGLMTHPDFYSY